MAISAKQEGRNLRIDVEDCAPFIIKPLPGLAGLQATETYMDTALGRATAAQTADALAMAIDGAVLNPETDRWEPNPDRPNSARMERELSLGETEDVAMAAFFWQTILKDSGVSIYLAEGGGVAGHTKAMWALVQRLGRSSLLTSPSSALDDLTQLLASSPSTSIPSGGVKPGKRPQDRRPAKKTSAGR